MAGKGKYVVCVLLLTLLQTYVEMVNGQNIIVDTFNITSDDMSMGIETFELDQPKVVTISLAGSGTSNIDMVRLRVYAKNERQDVIKGGLDWEFTTSSNVCELKSVDRNSSNSWILEARVKITILGPRAKCSNLSEVCVRILPASSNCQTEVNDEATSHGSKCLNFVEMSGNRGLKKICNLPITDIRLKDLTISSFEKEEIEYKSAHPTSVNVSFDVENTGGKYIRNPSFDIRPYFRGIDGVCEELDPSTAILYDVIPPEQTGSFQQELVATLPNESCNKFTHLCLDISPTSLIDGGTFETGIKTEAEMCLQLIRGEAGQKKCLSEIKLSNFTVHNILQGGYQIDKNTTVTFSVDLVNVGPSPVIISTSGNISIVFVVLRLGGANGQTVGETEILLKQDLPRNARHSVRKEKAVVIVTGDAECERNVSKICAGVSFDRNAPNYNVFKDENFDCLPLGIDIDEGGGGEILCRAGGSVIQWYHIVLLVLATILLLCVILFLCRCWVKHKQRTDEPSEAGLQRPRSISLAHLYEDISSRLSHIHNPFRKPGMKDGENPYDITILGEGNVAFHPDSKDNPYDSKISLEGGQPQDAGDNSSETSGILIIDQHARPSQPNVYIENQSFIRLLSPSNGPKETFSIEGLPTSESTDDLGVDESDCNVMHFGGSDKIEHETAEGSQDEISDAKKNSETAVDSQESSVAFQIEPFQETPSPKFSRPREQSVDIPLHMAPPIPSDSRFDSDRDPNTEESSFPMIANPLHSDPASQNPDLNEVALDQEPDLEPDPEPDPEPNPEPKLISSPNASLNPVSDFPGSVPDSHAFIPDKPKLQPKPKLGPKPGLKPKPDPDPHPDDPGQSSTKTDPASEPVPNLPDADELEDKPIIPPRSTERSKLEEDENSDHIAVPERMRNVPKLSIYKEPEEGVINIDDSSLTPKLPKSPASSLKGGVDPKIMKAAIERVRTSQSKPPDPNALEIPPNSHHQEAIDPSPLSPHDPEIMQAIMENYLSLMAEICHEDSDYETPNKQNLAPDPPFDDSGPLRRRKSYSAQLTLQRRRKTVNSGDIYVNQWDKSWEFKRANLSVDRTKPLGEGQFGKVYKGVATGVKGRTGDVLVAVKELKDVAKNDDKNEFLKELAIHTVMKKHPHVVELLGCCIRDEPICIVTEYLSGGDLLGFLRKKKFRDVGREMIWHYVAKFGLHIAKGMAYVAKMEIVHRDLAARNILITEDEVCKVSDFGFARDIFGLEAYTKAPEKAPIRWYAPESVMDNQFTSMSDVWSFGILLFEIATLGKTKPYERQSNNEVRWSVSAGVHPSRPPYCNEKLFLIMKMCWRKQPEDRSTFSELVNIFEELQSCYSGQSQEVPRASSPDTSEDESPPAEIADFEEGDGEESAL